MNPAALAVLVKGLKEVVDKHGFERARSDASWLYNILADYSPQTSALNRVVATVAREGFADLLRRATTVGESDAVVGQAVSRLVSAHAIEQGATLRCGDGVGGDKTAKMVDSVPTRSFPAEYGGSHRVFRTDALSGSFSVALTLRPRGRVYA